jgi:hypothetical protein
MGIESVANAGSKVLEAAKLAQVANEATTLSNLLGTVGGALKVADSLAKIADSVPVSAELAGKIGKASSPEVKAQLMTSALVASGEENKIVVVQNGEFAVITKVAAEGTGATKIGGKLESVQLPAAGSTEPQPISDLPLQPGKVLGMTDTIDIAAAETKVAAALTGKVADASASAKAFVAEVAAQAASTPISEAHIVAAMPKLGVTAGVDLTVVKAELKVALEN